MRQHGTQVLMVLGICLLCFAVTVFAQPGDHGNQGKQGNPVAAPEIDVGAAAGALTIAAGVLTILGERWRRQ